MDAAYRAEAWQALFGAVAGAAAALLGLLFVALSLNLRQIMPDPGHAARAREALGGLLILVLLAVIVLIPAQERRVLGVELLALGVVLVGLSVRLQSRTVRRLRGGRRLEWVARILPFNLATLAVLVSGGSLLAGRFGGLYWLIPTVLIYLLRSVLNAWTLLVQVAQG
jgi:modulator of FtsH protease